LFFVFFVRKVIWVFETISSIGINHISKFLFIQNSKFKLVWSKDSDRNDVIFEDKAEYEENVKPSVNFELKTEGEIKREIKDYFASQFLVELVDSPQILDEYFYLEFDGAKGDVKMRLPYETNKEDFLAMSSEDRFNWINREALDFLIY